MLVHLRILALALGAFTGACSLNGDRWAEGPATGTPEVVVRVINQQWNQVTIYSATNAQRRLGEVAGNTSGELRLAAADATGAAPIRFLIRPLGGGRQHLTHAVHVQPGDLIELRVGTQLQFSTVSVSPGES